jgi:myosin heavy subunit
MINHIHRICHVGEATTLRWTFEGGMREATQEALVLLRHEVEEQMEQSQYHHFPSRAREGAEAVVMLTEDHDHIGCFTDQVKLTHALVRDLDEAIKEVNLLGEHEEESSQKITELEALCKRLKEEAHKLKEEKTTLEGMIQSRDELIMEMAEEYGLNHMGENNDNEDEDDDDDDKGNTIAPPAPMPAAVPEEIIEEEAPVENGPHELDDLDDLYDLDDDPNEGRSDMDGWFPKDGSNDRD